MSSEGKPSSDKLSKGDDAEEDVPDDFFDDFSNNDFMAGLDVVDAWEDEVNNDQNQDQVDAKVKNVDKKIPGDKDGVKKAEKEKVIDNCEINESCSNISKSASVNTKSNESIETTDNSSSSASNDSDVNKPKLDLKDIKLNSECKVILQRDIKSLTKEKINQLSEKTKKQLIKDTTTRSKDEKSPLHANETKIISTDDNQRVKSNSTRISDSTSAIRRDPDKTRRDIQRNKDKISKEINAKYLDQKLRLVETGLVPPGTEMDVDLSKEKITDFACQLREAERKDRTHSNHSNSHDRHHTSTKRRRNDPKKPSKRHKGKSCTDNLSLSPSPVRQIRNITPATNKTNLLERRGRYNVTIGDHEPHSPLPLSDREHSGSSGRRTLVIAEDITRGVDGSVVGVGGGVMGKGERIPRRVIGGRVSRSRSRSYEKYRAYKRSPSPTMKGYGGRGKGVAGKRDRSRSPMKRDRRDRDYKPRDHRERSSSPNQQQQQRTAKKPPTFLEELNEKLTRQQSTNPSNERRTFLEEIREKIYQTHQPTFPQQYHPIPMAIAPVPAPVPAPQQFHQQIPPSPIVYDQSFFIGDASANAQRVLVVESPQQQQQLMMAPSVGQPFRLPDQMVVQQHTSAQIAIGTPQMPEMLNYQQQQQQQQQQEQQQRKLDKESIAKLFNDKQITLTDFLSITSKVAGSDRPIDLPNKIKVISRCQDAVKAMSKDSKVTGRFFMRKRSSSIDNASNLPDHKLISPLKRSPAVRFRFTSKAPSGDDPVYRTSVQLLLHNLGLPDGTEPIRDPTPERLENQNHVAQPLIVRQGNNLKSIVPTDDAILIAAPKRDVLQKMSQTEPVNLCRECNLRAKKTFLSVGCQFDDRVLVSVGTQMSGTEDTFTPARAHLQGLLKSRSLASLTPAQILAQVATKTTEQTSLGKNDRAFASPELKRRADLSSNWNQSDDFTRGNRDYDNTTRRHDMFNYNEQQQERHLQQQLQMTMEMQQNANRTNPRVRFPGNNPMFPGQFNSGMSGDQFGSNSQSFAGNRFYN